MNTIPKDIIITSFNSKFNSICSVLLDSKFIQYSIKDKINNFIKISNIRLDCIIELISISIKHKKKLLYSLTKNEQNNLNGKHIPILDIFSFNIFTKKEIDNIYKYWMLIEISIRKNIYSLILNLIKLVIIYNNGN